MGFFKNYLTPGKVQAKTENVNEKTQPQETTTTNPGVRQNDASRGTPMGGSAAVTPAVSRPVSMYPNSIYSDAEKVDMRADVMCNYLYEQQLERQYATGVMPGEGVVMKKGRDNYACLPPQLRDMEYSLYDMAMQLNVPCAMTVTTRAIHCIMSSRRTSDSHIPMPDGLNLQILRSIRELPRCQKHHFAAFMDDTNSLVVWDDDPKKVLARAENIEKQLVQMLWGMGDMEGEDDSEENNGGESLDMEALAEPPRRIKLTSPLMISLTLALCISCIGLGLRHLAFEIATDGSYTRLALVVVIPLQLWVSLFFFSSIISNLFQCFGPVTALDRNSAHYSGKPPAVRLNPEDNALPHVTIQMPVYKEGLRAVIMPTIQSLRACISTYEMQGGSASIFINDDGMQLISTEEAQARREFYEENNIGWVSRPGHNPNPAATDGDGEKKAAFIRRGKFKKASNMNYGLMVSNAVEAKLSALQRPEGWTSQDEDEAYQLCLGQVLEEHEGRTWADGNIRIGDYILIIDSDTRVPKDCLLDAVSEMEQSPEVAVLQFSSGVMRVTSSFFEAGIEWFTNLIYTCISYSVSNGDAPPFVGHNAFLRWSAVQDAAAYTDEDGYEKYWSEYHVSEDFEMALQLQCAGYTVRFAAYAGEGFQEGVSLTVYDELARWEKYAYGCNELMFHPLKYWLFKGPVTPLFRKFLLSGIHIHKKISICTYIGTYYAIAAAWIITVMNYFMTGWFFGLYDKFYLDSFAIYISIIVVFTGFGNVALAVLRYRIGAKSILSALFENFKWVPLITIFLGGISLHVSQAILCHFFGIDLQWGATAKEYEEVNFLQEVPRLLRKFKGTFLFVTFSIALVVCGKFAFPDQWKITYFASIYPLVSIASCHFLLPTVLNPALMVFAW